MNLLLCADKKVGFGIACHLIEHYPKDLALVVTLNENEIFQAAHAARIPTYIFTTGAALVDYLKDKPIDLGILAWWPKIIAPPLLDFPKRGFINTHPSFLPHNRGKHYNFWSIVEETPFGVSMHHVDAGIDSGDIVSQKEIKYDWCDTGESLYIKAQDAMLELFKETYPKIRVSESSRRPQDLSKGSIHKSNEIDSASRIDLNFSYLGKDILNLLRARTFQGHPSCWFEADGHRYEVRVEIRRSEK